ncbi:glycoside hydrolase family 6 protein [Vibrio paucivorans]|uniref:Glucanase n=1 Tax=Vibrio paucivorans TaxID=2829489 RepID=A0A9X3CI93_9VIBR|nr:glycoside hydrolase family 6 protein [Vibrio paucivorans]MCW8336338.1 glycoside hydrolase family 6 protein [Vibrio paucivorans]
MVHSFKRTAPLAALLMFTLDASAEVQCNYTIENEWDGGFIGAISVTNSTSNVIDGWEVTWEYEDGSSVISAWDAQLSGSNPYIATNLQWNNLIQPGETVSMGFQGAKPAGQPASLPQVNGDVCGQTASNTPPVALFSATQSGLDVIFDATSSTDADGDELTYSWDLGDNKQGSGAILEHTYSSEGSYTVTLEVSDGVETNEYTLDITVVESGENQPPVANIEWTNNGMLYSFDASNSSDNEGDQLNYTWSFGDGATDTGVAVSYQYNTEGLYSVTLTVSDGVHETETTTDINVTSGSSDVPHLSNPFVGASSYINPDYSKFVDASMALVSDQQLKDSMAQVKEYPTAVWLDRIDAIYGGDINGGRLSLEQHFEQALEQQQAGKPMTISIVIYNLPDRDCAALASNGTLHSTQNGLEIYKRDYIDVIANIAADPRFEDLRIITVLEPDSLPNLITNTDVPKCATVSSDGTYVKGIQYALERFSQINNVYTYLDIAHSGWLGWDSNMLGAVQLYTEVVAGVADGDMSVLDGFISNVSNYTPVEEIYLPDPSFDFDGDYMGVESTDYYEWNPVFDEKDFAELLHAEFVKQGFPTELAMLIDTSRNGWGADDRPTAANTDASTEEQYVMDNKLDRRLHRGNWCNASGAGIGERPQVQPYGSESVIQAYVWIKPPGESDGTSDSSQTEPDEEGKSFDPMCSSEFVTPGGVLTGAMDGAPPAGSWFHEQFKMLVENAYPKL